MKLSAKETLYDSEVLTRFELYNSLFQTLPFYQVKHTGRLLPFFASHVEQAIEDKLNPEDTIESFFGQYEQYVQELDRIDLLFRIIQYIERQVVLFDAVEDAAFLKTGRADDTGMVDYLKHAGTDPNFRSQLLEGLKELSLRLVLTAHPTQFYPGEVLAIINDLTEALKVNDINTIHLLLQQLGKTPFLQLSKPTPVDEARSLAWFLEHVFYHAVSDIQRILDEAFDNGTEARQLVELGFWPGGDRDGNPNVDVSSTKEVSSLLRTVLFRCYYRDFRVLKRRITFKGVEKYIAKLQELFYENSFNPVEKPLNVQDEILDNLEGMKRTIRDYHDNLFVDLIDDLLRKVKTFGNYFASIDVRQDSSVLRNTFAHIIAHIVTETTLNKGYANFTEEEKIKAISFDEQDIRVDDQADPLIRDTVSTIRYIKDIQTGGGEKAAHRFIISNCQQASDILELMQLFLWSGWKKDELHIDFVPLFETVDDLKRAADVMRMLYSHKFYREHLAFRGAGQTIMLGFSDSTKDGGYLMANWSIYNAKIALTAISRDFDVDLTFFDGRGGPPARGGGKTHKFYASMGKEIANRHIQLTIQGQTISSQYGSLDAARFNMEQLLHAGMLSALQENPGDTLSNGKKELIGKMADWSHKKFMDLRHDPLFLPYLEELSPLRFLSSINISSRPVKRNSDAGLRLEDLRAISFVTAWSQLKQSIPGFYGLGTALKQADDSGSWEHVEDLYRTSGMFRTIIDNSIMAMSKSNFDITAYLEKDARFGDFYTVLRNEFDLTKRYVLRLSESEVLMEKYPVERKSIAAREKIIQPLVVIQHYAIKRLQHTDPNDAKYEILSKLLTRTVYGIVNAGRNLV